MLSTAYRALPDAIAIGKWLSSLPQADVYSMVDKVQEVMEGRLDGRLAMQYAMYVLCTKKVCL